MPQQININAFIRKLERTKRTLPSQLGNIIVKHFKGSFRKGGFEGSRFKKWQKRKRSIKSAEPKKRRALLVESGALRNGIRMRSASFRRIRVGSYNTEYARVHNRGQTTHPTVTAKMRKWAFAQFAASEGQNRMARSISYQPVGTKLNVPHPARPFIQRSNIMNRKIKKRIRKAIKNVLIS
ncbi:MAG: phage virion morphogenesis protein [Nitrosomonadaceae bacterium]